MYPGTTHHFVLYLCIHIPAYTCMCTCSGYYGLLMYIVYFAYIYCIVCGFIKMSTKITKITRIPKDELWGIHAGIDIKHTGWTLELCMYLGHPVFWRDPLKGLPTFFFFFPFFPPPFLVFQWPIQREGNTGFWWYFAKNMHIDTLHQLL